MHFPDAIRIFSRVTVIRGGLSGFRISSTGTSTCSRDQMTDLAGPFIFSPLVHSARLSPWTRTDFYIQLRATDWNRVTFYIYPRFPLTIIPPKTAVGIRGLLPTDNYVALRSRCSRFKKRRARDIHDANFCFWSLFILSISFVLEKRCWSGFSSSPRRSTFQVSLCSAGYRILSFLTILKRYTYPFDIWHIVY